MSCPVGAMRLCTLEGPFILVLLTNHGSIMYRVLGVCRGLMGLSSAPPGTILLFFHPKFIAPPTLFDAGGKSYSGKSPYGAHTGPRFRVSGLWAAAMNSFATLWGLSCVTVRYVLFCCTSVPFVRKVPCKYRSARLDG